MDKKLIKALLISTAIVLAYSYILIPLGIFSKPILLSQDLLSKCIYKISPRPSQAKDIVVVSIDRESLRNLEQKWPWTRDIFAQFLLRLKEYNPKVIYLDFSFIGKTEHDDTFAQALATAGNVIIPYYFDEKGKPLFPEQKFIESAAGFGPVNKLRDIDLTIRDALLVYFSTIGSIIDFSVELITICKYFGVTIGDVSKEGGNLIINIEKEKKKLKIPIKENGTLPIKYSVALDDIKVIPFWKVIKETFPLETFRDKIVIVGLTDKALLDVYLTPLGMSSGIEIIVNTILTVITGDFIKYVSKDINLPIILLIVLLITLTVFRLSPWKSFFIAILELLVYLGIAFLLSWYGYLSEVFSVLFLGVIIYIVIKIYKFICLLEEQNVDLQKALKDLKEAEAGLIESERLAAIGKLSAQLSHEINNPLCAIQNSVNTIKYIISHGGATDKIYEISERVSEELKRLTKLSRDILSFSRPPKEEAKSVNVNEILKETINIYRGQFEEQKINVSLNLSSKMENITVSPDRLKQVFSNLILNSQEAMPSGGLLIINTKLVERLYIEIEISDTGYGIPSENIKKIFDPFFTTKKEGKGTGLGLFMVYNIIKGYGGVINVKSTLGKGTTFIIRFPIK